MPLLQVTIPASPVPTRLTVDQTDPTAAILCGTVIIQSARANTAALYIGDSTVDSATPIGLELPAPASGLLLPSLSIPSPGNVNSLNLADIWIDSVTGSQIVNVFYVIM